MYDALIDIIDDHMPEVFDEDLVVRDDPEQRKTPKKLSKEEHNDMTPDKPIKSRYKTEFSFANSNASVSDKSEKSGRQTYESEKRN